MILGYLANFPHGKVNSQTTLSAYCGIAARVAPMFLYRPPLDVTFRDICSKSILIQLVPILDSDLIRAKGRVKT